MITVEQIQNLDAKVRKALELIEHLREENEIQRLEIEEYQQKIAKLESVISGYKKDQVEIEEGIRDVLSQLDSLEDQIHSQEETVLETETVPTAPQQPVNTVPEPQINIQHQNNAHTLTAEKPAQPFSAEAPALPVQEKADFSGNSDSVQAERIPELEIF